MKSMYWHLHQLPRTIIVLYCIFVLLGLFCVEHFKRMVPQPYYHEKYAAALLAEKAMKNLKLMRGHLGIKIDSAIDPRHTGLIGRELTTITTDHGVLHAKQMTLNPNIAGLFVEWLEALKLKPGTPVAVTMTGSFPGVNIAALAAIKTLQLRPMMIFSAGASQYGANIPGFTWVDMYHNLQKDHIFPYEPLGVSLGGHHDDAFNMTPAGKEILMAATRRYHYPYLAAKGTRKGIDARMAIFFKHRGHYPQALVNVGGGVAAIGLTHRKGAREIKNGITLKPFPSGVIKSIPISVANTDSVALRFLKRGLPVVNAHNIAHSLVKKYHFPSELPLRVTIGQGDIYRHPEYNPVLAVIVLILDILVFIGIVALSRKYTLSYKR